MRSTRFDSVNFWDPLGLDGTGLAEPVAVEDDAALDSGNLHMEFGKRSSFDEGLFNQIVEQYSYQEQTSDRLGFRTGWGAVAEPDGASVVGSSLDAVPMKGALLARAPRPMPLRYPRRKPTDFGTPPIGNQNAPAPVGTPENPYHWNPSPPAPRPRLLGDSPCDIVPGACGTRNDIEIEKKVEEWRQQGVRSESAEKPPGAQPPANSPSQPDGTEGELDPNRGDDVRAPAPFIPEDPSSPESVNKRQSERRREAGVNQDHKTPLPDRGPGGNIKGSHGAKKGNAHGTGERNVGTDEEHSRIPKGSHGMPRGSQGGTK